MIGYKKWLIEDLQNLETDRFAISHMERELETLKHELYSIKGTNFDKMPAGNVTQEDKLITAIAKRDELEATLEATRRHVADMEALLDAITDDERHIVDRMLVNREQRAATELAKELGYDQRQIYRKRDDALRHLAKLRFGVGYRP